MNRKYLFIFIVSEKASSTSRCRVEVVYADNKRYAWREVTRKTPKGVSVRLCANIRLNDVPYEVCQDGLVFFT
ncbi:Uncharacterised protein [Raoultella terrigena]|uniref:Uncharacterized protein n=1 Tax=Raoultella terrigena TaxID=577 RepID=A0A4U9D7N4_RAOTE|nr:Uncharacterised protein [Raoultella terrigena]